MPETQNYKWENELIGHGAYGFVYKGVAKDDANKKVAIKKFQGTLNMYIKREAETMALTDHQCVVKFLGLEHSAGLLHKVLVMEYCDQGNLFDLIESKPNGMTSFEFVRFCKNLVGAMHHLWEKNIIHRDIKPANILVAKTNDGQIIYKLADFGASRTLQHDATFTSIYGTPEYLHPDIFAKMYAKAIDVIPSTHQFTYNNELWSIGTTLFEAATGVLPFAPEQGRNDLKTMFKMTTMKPEGSIYAKQLKNGEIEWFKNFPESCELVRSLKEIFPPFLAGLLKVSIRYFIR